jgi:hypothetical protein
VIVEAESESELHRAFPRIVEAGAGALLVSGGPLFASHRRTVVALVARHAFRRSTTCGNTPKPAA